MIAKQIVENAEEKNENYKRKVMGSNDGRKKRLKHFSFIFMNHWGDFYLLPSLSLDIVYSRATWTFVWLVFRVDYKSYKRLPDWFMKYVWSVMNFDFLKKKQKEE